MLNKKYKVLLLGGWVDQAFTFVRSFSKQENVELYVADSWPNSSVAFSRHCKGFKLLPKYNDSRYSKIVLNYCIDKNIDVVLPVHHEDLMSIADKRELFEKRGIKLPIPNYSVLRKAVDKYRLFQIAKKNGLSVPQTYLLGKCSLKKISSSLGYPAVIKLRRSTGQRGQKKVENYQELRLHVHHLLKAHMPNEIIVQEYIPGTVLDSMYTVGLLYDNKHNLKVCVPLKKIRSRAYTGGTAVCTRAENRLDVRESAINLCKAYGNWVGIVDVEIKVDPKDQPHIVEINPRPWGSIYGSYVAGVDLPLLWLYVAFGKDFNSIDKFREGVYGSFLCRDLVLFWDLIKELFWGKREEAWHVLKTYVYPYISKGADSQYSTTSDFVVDDPLPFLSNIFRMSGMQNLLMGMSKSIKKKFNNDIYQT